MSTSTKIFLRSKFKSTGTAYLLWFFLGFHFAYLDKWLLQFLFWITGGGFLIWWVIELFLIPGRVSDYNKLLQAQIDEIDARERKDDILMMAMLKNSGASTGNLSAEEKARLYDQMTKRPTD